MKKVFVTISVFLLLLSCNRDDIVQPEPYDNPELSLNIPPDFPALNNAVNANKPTKYGVDLGERLFNEKRFSANNTISCAGCHHKSNAFADSNALAIGIYGRAGLRNTPPSKTWHSCSFITGTERSSSWKNNHWFPSSRTKK